MIEWKPAIGERWIGSPIVIEEERYLIRAATRQVINWQIVQRDEVFAVPKLVTMKLESLMNATLIVMVIGERRAAGKRFWECRISQYDPSQLELELN